LRRPDEITEFGAARLLSETTRIDVRVRDIPAPRPEEQILIGDETFLIQGSPRRERERQEKGQSDTPIPIFISARTTATRAQGRHVGPASAGMALRRREGAAGAARAPDPEHAHRVGFSLEYVLIQQAAPGCKVDGGRYKMGDDTRPDAEVIAATIAGLPDSLGGKRMAIHVADLARAGLTPDWMPGAVPLYMYRWRRNTISMVTVL
jgi:hypothetical protein